MRLQEKSSLKLFLVATKMELHLKRACRSLDTKCWSAVYF